MIFGVKSRRRLIQRRFGLEVADAKFYAAMFEAVPQHRDEPAPVASVIGRRAEIFHGVDWAPASSPKLSLKRRTKSSKMYPQSTALILSAPS